MAVFDEPMLGQSALDRFCHRAHQFVIEGESYRKRTAPGSVSKINQKALTSTMGNLEKMRPRPFKREVFLSLRAKWRSARKIRSTAGSLRSERRQGSKPASLVRRSASLTASSLRLQSFYGGAGAPRFLVVPDCDFTNCLWSWRSCRLRKIALRAPYCKIFRQGYRGAPL